MNNLDTLGLQRGCRVTASAMFEDFNEACETFIEYHADFFNLCTDYGSMILDAIDWLASWLPVIG